MKKFALSVAVFFTLFSFPSVSLAADTSGCNSASFNGTYCSLAPIGDFIPAQIVISQSGLTTYLNNLFRFGIALAGALAVLMIVIGGLQYLSTDAVSGKNDGRARITQALQGLLLALLSYLILNTINPQILNTELTLNTVKSPTISDGTTFNPNNLTAIPGAGSTAPIGPNNYSIPKDGGFDPALNANASTPQKTLSTTFGLNDSQDSGVGSPIMGDGKGNGILTNDPNVRGVSLPQEVWEGYFNIPHHAGTDSDPLPYSKWEVVRNSAVEVTGPNGKTSILPVVDLGPGAGAAAGVGADVTHAVDQDLGINGKGEISYRILPGYYTTNPKPALTQVPGK